MDTVTPLAGQPLADTGQGQAGTALGDTDAVGCESALPFLTGIEVAPAASDASHETAHRQAAREELASKI